MADRKAYKFFPESEFKMPPLAIAEAKTARKANLAINEQVRFLCWFWRRSNDGRNLKRWPCRTWSGVNR